MTEFQQAFKDYYEDLKERCRRDAADGGGYNTCLEDETFMDEFEITDTDYAGRLLNAVHAGNWNIVENLVEDLWADYRICIQSKLMNTGPEEIVI